MHTSTYMYTNTQIHRCIDTHLYSCIYTRSRTEDSSENQQPPRRGSLSHGALPQTPQRSQMYLRYIKIYKYYGFVVVYFLRT